MSTRKRKNAESNELEVKAKPSKRAKLLSNLWKSQEEALESSGSSQSIPSSSIYRIKGIIGERKDKYLIDWADDPITGENFKADWQAKSNVNSAAVRVWKERQTVRSPPRNRSARRPQRRSRRKKANIQSLSPVKQLILSASTSQNQTATILERNEFLNSANSFSATQHYDSDSGLGESSPPSRSNSPACEGKGIVPDSQSPPGSSSYIPTQIAPGDSQLLSPSGLSRPDSASFSTNTDSDLSSEHTSSLEDPPVASNSTDQDTHQRTRRSRSAIPSSLREPSVLSKSITTPPSLPRSVSDPGVWSLYVSDKDSEEQIQVPESRVQTPRQSQEREEARLNRLSLIDSQILLASASQGSRVSLRSINSLHDGQQVQGFKLVDSVSELSPAVVIRDSQDTKSQATRSQTTKAQQSSRRSAPSDAFLIAEDCIADPHPSQATTEDESVLSIRDNNSQPNKQEPTGQKTNYSRSRLEATGFDSDVVYCFPTAFDSLEPPRPPSDFEDDMSDTPMDDGGGHKAPPQLSLKERLKRGRAEADATLASRKAERQRARASVGRRPPAPDQRPSQPDQLKVGPPLTSSSQSSELLERQLSQAINVPTSPLGRVPVETHIQSPGLVLSPRRQIGELQSPKFPSFTEAQSPITTSRATQSPHRPSFGQTHSPDNTAHAMQSSHRPSVRQTQSPEATSRATKSPSAIPEKPPYQIQEEPSRLEAEPPLEIMITKDILVPVHGPQSIPHTPITPSKLSIHKEVSLSPQTASLEVRNLGPLEFVVPLSMQARVQQQYLDTINFFGKEVRKFLEKKSRRADLLERINTLLDEVSNVTIHMDLQGSGASSQEGVNPADEAAYAESCSEKFKFLGHFLTIAREDELHIGIVARPGPLLDLIETFLKAKEVSYNRPDKRSKFDAQSRLEATIIPSGAEGASFLPRSADLIFAFDESFNANDTQVKLLRRHVANTEVSPVLRLIVFASAEHIDLCLSRTLEPVDRLRRLVLCMLQTQRYVGELHSDEPTSSDCAEDVLNYLQRGAREEFWTLPATRSIDNIAYMASDSSLSDAMSDVSDEYRPMEPLRYWPNPIPPKIRLSREANKSVEKRPFDLVLGDSLETQAKKQKLARNFNLGRELKEPERTPEHLEKLLHQAKQHTSNLERQIMDKEEIIRELRRWAEIRQFLEENLRKSNIDLEFDKKEIRASMDLAAAEIANLKSKMIAANVAQTQANEEIKQLRLANLNHPDSVVADQELQASKLRKLADENAALTKRATNIANEREYFSQAYQQASEAASVASSEADALKEKVPNLEQRLKHQNKERRELINKDENAGLRKEVNNLRDTLKQRDGLNRQLHADLDALKRGRAGVQTRGSSQQPRSPRGGSRGVSPAGMLQPGGKALSGLGSRFNDRLNG